VAGADLFLISFQRHRRNDRPYNSAQNCAWLYPADYAAHVKATLRFHRRKNA